MSVVDPFGQHTPTSTPAPPSAETPVAPTPDIEAAEIEEIEETDAQANRVGGARAAAVVEYVATAFADNPDAIEIETRQRGHGDDVSIYIHADRGDVGRLIGRRGRVINAMRQAARAAGAIDGERVQLDIAE